MSARTWLSGCWLGGIALALTALVAPTGAGATTAATGWTISPTSSTLAGGLYGAACTSSDVCWAVGYQHSGDNDQTLIEEWDGTSWSVVTSPDVTAEGGGTLDNDLSGVACASATECWAVGQYDDSSGYQHTLILGWNGTSWSLAAAPEVTPESGTVSNVLNGVACASTSECWAVGSYTGSDTLAHVLVEEWGGSAPWTVSVPASLPTDSDQGVLEGVACASAGVCWATGYYRSSSGPSLDEDQTLVEGWDGVSWSKGASPDDSSLDNILYGVTCTSATECWATGMYTLGTEPNVYGQTLIEEWSGTSWSIVSSPDSGTGSNDLLGVGCASATECWAAGSYAASGDTDQTLIEEWGGTSWSIVTSPNSGTSDNDLEGAACAPAAECWAVGDYSPPDPPLIEEYPAAAPTPTPTPTPSPASVPVPPSGSAGGAMGPVGWLLAMGGLLLVGTAVAWRRGRRLGVPRDL
jgi:hypothetical protein